MGGKLRGELIAERSPYIKKKKVLQAPADVKYLEICKTTY
jgi:hypothetical protein